MHADLHTSSRQLKGQVLPALQSLANVKLQAAFYFRHQGGARGQSHGRQPHLLVCWEGDVA